MADKAMLRRYETLDHWRGIACLAVLVTHSVWNQGGWWPNRTIAAIAARMWIGVPVFFVISGYCISATVEAHLRQGRRLPSYFLRRLRRIFPPYWFVLGGSALLVAVLDVAGVPMVASGEFLRPWWFDFRQWVGNISLTETWRFHVVPGQKALFLGHAWTLCYEEQFYAVAGVLLWTFGRRWFDASIGLSIIIGVGLLVADSYQSSLDGFFFDGQWFQFWFGMILYHAIHRAGILGRSAITGTLLTVIVVVLFDIDALFAPDKNITQTLFVAALFAVLAISLYRFDAQLARQSSLVFFRWCGTMCYSLYLLHLPVVKTIHALCFWIGFEPEPMVSLALCVPPSLLLSWRFHVAVERRFLNSRVDPTPTSLLASSATTPCAGRAGSSA